MVAAQVKIYANQKLFELAKQAGLDVPDVRGVDVSFVEMVEMNKDDMKTGKIEGLVITLDGEENGYKFVKWKGAQEFQPHAHKNFDKANEIIQHSGTHEDIKKAFKMIHEVNTDISQNKLALKKQKKKKPGQKKGKGKNRKGKENEGGGSLSDVDKEIIMRRIPHCQMKFDSVEEIKKRGKSPIDEYVDALTKEVRDHLANENTDYLKVDERTRVWCL